MSTEVRCDCGREPGFACLSCTQARLRADAKCSCGETAVQHIRAGYSPRVERLRAAHGFTRRGDVFELVCARYADAYAEDGRW